MPEVRVRQPVAPDDAKVMRHLAEAAESVDGHRALGDSVWRDLDHPAPTSALLLTSDGEQPVGALHVAGPDDQSDRFKLAVVVDPAHRGSDVARKLVDRAIDVVREQGGGLVELWAFGADDATAELARTAGFAPERELWQLRVPLPINEEARWPDGVHVRTFAPGRDEDEWVSVNNRAFRDDPDQSSWTVDTLARRESEPWFDPEGFLLVDDERGLAGFCWTRVHPPAPPNEPEALGEIYVIGVDPDRQGKGLGRALVVAGLDSLHRRGIRTGMLFVDAGNEPAVALYRALGFDVARADRAYLRTVA